MEATIVNGRLFDNVGQHNMMYSLSAALDELGYQLMASHVRQKYDPESYKAYISLIRYHIKKDPSKDYVLNYLGDKHQ